MKSNYLKIILIIIIFVVFIYIINYLLHKPSSIGLNDHFSNRNDLFDIPKIIIQTWKDDNIPEKYISDIESVKKFNPDYEYLFFTDESIEIFLKEHYPEYYLVYLKLPVIIQRIDFFRYIVIYHYGGIYLDLDITCFESFDDILKYDSVFPVDQNFTDEKCMKSRYKHYCDIGQKFMVGQYAFAAKPKNKFIKVLIDGIVNNINEYVSSYKVYGTTLQYVYSTTGPDYVTDEYIKYGNKDSIHILHYDSDQYFGKYAKHNFFGTWKKK
jgi:mannosyltransferase OCH1-like enzyme